MSELYDGYINTDIVERLGITVVELPEGSSESDNARRHLNANVMEESAILIVTCVDPRDTNKHAWIVLWQHPESVPFWEWGRNYGDLGDYLDPIIALAKQFKLPLFVPVDKVIFRDDSNRVKAATVPVGVNRFRAWLMSQYEFVSIGPSPNRYGEILCLDPEDQPLIEVPVVVQEFFQQIEDRLEDDAHIVWFQRETRRILDLIKFVEKS